jgi:tetratricopeptide (TPR) repeat protein
MTVPEQSSRNNQSDDFAYTLMKRALELIHSGSWRAAVRALEQAAASHAQANRIYDEARCLQLAATLSRSAGDSNKAHLLIDQATAVAPSVQPLLVSILSEEAETAFSEGHYEQAVSAWTAAIHKARLSGLKAVELSAVLRRRASVLVVLSRIEQSARDFDEAFQLLDTSRGKESAFFVRIEQAGILLQHGNSDAANQVLTLLEKGLQSESISPNLLSEFLLSRARLARSTNKLDIAVEYARSSRNSALKAVAPTIYFAASVELAEVMRICGDFSGAYGTLVSAWATLSDVLSKNIASSWIEPCIMAYRLDWGKQTFEEVKKAYEVRRRAEIKRKD